MTTVVLVGIGGFLGANVRFLLSIWAAERVGAAFPYGTMLVNTGGSLLMGLVLGLLAARFGDDPSARLLVATGFLGAETTYSTFAYETVALVRAGDRAAAARNVAGNVALGLLAVSLGLAIAGILAARVAR